MAGKLLVGVAIQGRDANDAIDQIARAERAGIDAAWATMGGAGGTDLLVTFGAALVRTERIVLGTSIVHTWAKRPLAYAQEAAALAQLGPGRFRLGLGATTAPMAARQYGVEHRKPLTQLREYITAIRTLLRDGQIDYQGDMVQVRARLAGAPLEVPVMGSAVQPGAYEMCGEFADGAISWMCPLSYLVDVAAPAVRRGAERAGREAPPIVAHVPVALTTDRAEARARARQQLAMYGQVPNYQKMFALAGHQVAAAGDYSDDLLDDLVVSGTEAEVAAALRRRIEAGVEVLAQPLAPAPTEGQAEHLAAVFAAVGAAARG
ncbi:MAG: LLM class flavin-dependent oxidoreductase [Dehalococcoidia bacterium]